MISRGRSARALLKMNRVRHRPDPRLLSGTASSTGRKRIAGSAMSTEGGVRVV
jgi:hypothetical protein